MQEFACLGSVAKSSNHGMTTIWKGKAISNNFKLRIIRAVAFSIATYGSELWAMTTQEEKKVNEFKMWGHRRWLRTF